jgi:hypothetical protein
MQIERWTQHLDLETRAAKTLSELAAALPQNRQFRIALFGSAPLQIAIEPTLLSGDVDVFCADEDFSDWVDKTGLASEGREPVIQVSSELNFRTSPRWRERVQSFVFGNCTFIVPHPIDILIGKLNRLEEKDLHAFRVTIEKTGHPTEAELIHELQFAVDLFRPRFDEEQGQDIADNCRRLWPLIYGHEIDPREEIIAPALAKRKEGYAEPTRDYKAELRELGRGED